MKTESAARIAAFMTASSANPIDLRRRSLDEEDDDLGEIPLKARSIVHRFSSLPKEDIIRIFRNKLRTINLIRLWHMRGIRLDALEDKDRIGLDNDTLKLWRATGSYKDFGNTI